MRGWLAHDSVVGVSTDLADLRVAVASDQHAARGTRPGMAIIHDTTMSPSKLELLTSWLPAQPWYVDTGREPELEKAGGFRLDDPRGEVGIEFMVVTDGSGHQATTYQVPLTYRARALVGTGSSLIGTAEHGVLGRRWIYDGPCDPVLVAQLVALIQGDTQPQAQSVSNTPDPTVTGHPVTDDSLTAIRSAVAASAPFGTDLRIQTAAPDGRGNGQLIVRVNRILHPGDDMATAGQASQPCLAATWRLPDRTRVHGILATAQYTQQLAPRR
jgi:Maltokinase N-terminal cap domain